MEEEGIVSIIEKLNIEELPSPYSEIASNFDLDTAIKMAFIFQGSQVYFQNIKNLLRDKVLECIKEEFTGFNYAELAKKYGYSERWIRILTSQYNKKGEQKC
ncbi:MAG: hypothetical protein N4A48_14335 [Tepidibacter sp.]|uniref:Mor transcription activator family protein n=1 Tax=Tepidibacter sp. TaxID=2529387 RepID=UPI0025CDC31B|nr:Mor transcription activator family protein [Tepidibacter sp.]MCT4509908.1 hypothetical protein [Tepidibacter sp.]